MFGFLAQTKGGAISSECPMCEVIVDRSIGALTAVRGSLAWQDSDSDGVFELVTSVFASSTAAPSATIGGGFVAVTGAAGTLSVWRSHFAHSSALLARGGAIMVGDDAQGRTHVHQSSILGCDAYWGGAIAITGFGAFYDSLSRSQRISQGGSSGVGSSAKLGLGWALQTDSSYAGFEANKLTDVEYLAFQQKAFSDDGSVQETGYAYLASEGLVADRVTLPPFEASLGGLATGSSEAKSGASLALLRESRITGCTAVRGGGIALGGTAQTTGPIPAIVSRASRSFTSGQGSEGADAHRAMHRIALGHARSGDVASIAGRAYTSGVLSGIDLLHFRTTDGSMQDSVIAMSQAVPDTTQRSTLGTGGGVHADGVPGVYAVGVVIADSVADSLGGCMDLVDSHGFVADGTRLVRCTSGNAGGGLSIEYTREEQDSALVLQGTSIVHSGARTQGGGLFANVVEQAIAEVLVHGCHAGISGGGVYLGDEALVKTMTRITLQSNAAG